MAIDTKSNRRLLLAGSVLFVSVGVVPVSWGESNDAKAGTNAPKVEAGKKVEVGKRDEGDFVVEKRSDGSTVKYKKKTSYDFEGSNIEGLYNKPSGSYISNIKDVKGRSIIRIRENFDAEVIDSSRLLK